MSAPHDLAAALSRIATLAGEVRAGMAASAATEALGNAVADAAATLAALEEALRLRAVEPREREKLTHAVEMLGAARPDPDGKPLPFPAEVSLVRRLDEVQVRACKALAALEAPAQPPLEAPLPAA